MKTKALFVLCLTVSIGLCLTSFQTGQAAPSTSVFVFDQVTQSNVASAAVGQNFTLDVRIANVVNLEGFEFYMTWNTTLLSFVSLKEGPFLNSSGAYQTYWVPKYPGFQSWPYTDTLYAASTLISATMTTSASGSGVLARVTFKALTEGVGTLDLQNSILIEYSTFLPRPQVAHSTNDGFFAYPLPRVVVTPAEVLGILPGESFNVSIDVVDVVNVYNWTLKMTWTANLLNATDIYEESFLSDAGATGFSSSIDQNAGTLYINNTLTGDPLSGVSGDGRLVTITFDVEARGQTDLDLLDVALYKQDGSVSPAAAESGLFSNTLRDVSITDASVSTTSVSRGQEVVITVIVKNNGLEDETFTVRVDFDSQSAGSKQVTDLVPDESETLTFQWDTSNVEPNTYTLKATVVETIPGETNKADNTRTIGTVTVTGGGGIDFNLLLIAGVVVVVVVIAIVALLLLRRRKK